MTPTRLHLLVAASLSMAACIGTIGDGGEDESSEGAVAPQGWAPGAMRRLTTDQYANSIHDIFGEQIQVSVPLEEDETNEAFLSMGAAKVGTSERGVEQYHAAALDIAAQVVASSTSYDVLRDCAPFQPGDACIATALEYFGKRLWRRDMTSEEVARIVSVQSSSDQQDTQAWELGMSYALAALIASPSFLYVPEIGEETSSGARRFTGFEMASRLAFSLWNSTPDDVLLGAAANGELSSAEGVRKQAERMLSAPRAADLATRFFGESWSVGTLAFGDKNTDVLPEWTPELLDGYLKEFDLVLRDMMERDTDVRELFTGDTTFVNDRVAQSYGMSGGSSEFEPVALSDGRSGLLTSGAVMSAVSPSDRTSPTHRGVFVLEQLLCVEVPPPPPNVDDTLNQPTPEEGLTLREKLEQHRSDPACASCHNIFDPLGFTFENFDSIGRYRDMDGDLPVDAGGSFEGTEFDSARALAEFIVSDPRLTSCLSKRLYTFAAGHLPTGNETGKVDEITDALRQHFSFKHLVLDVVTSDGFRHLDPSAAN